MNKDDFIVSKTDLQGRITYCNEVFMDFAGLSEKDLLGQPHKIVRHPDMPSIIFKLLWERIKAKDEIFAYVKNMSADGSYYWVYANVTASVDSNDNIIGYYSVRRKPKNSSLNTITELYRTLLEKERSGGTEASGLYLTDLLEKAGKNYNEYINSLQNGGV
ncbi:MAG: PAS domain-containing protein [Campylobacterota bacterium]